MKNTTSSNENIEKNGKQKEIPFVEEANLRDYFAAKALGLCFAQYLNHAEAEGFQDGWRDGVAADAYQMADAMLRAREAS